MTSSDPQPNPPEIPTDRRHAADACCRRPRPAPAALHAREEPRPPSDTPPPLPPEALCRGERASTTPPAGDWHYQPLPAARAAGASGARSAPRRSRTTCRGSPKTCRFARPRLKPWCSCSTRRTRFRSSRDTARSAPAGSTRRSSAASRNASPHLRELADRKQTILKSIAGPGRADRRSDRRPSSRPSRPSGSKTSTCRSSRRRNRWRRKPARRDSGRWPRRSATATPL